MKSYHNTNGLTGNDLKKAEKKCKNQEESVLEVFVKYPNNAFTPEHIRELAGMNSNPITSIRRAITNLTVKGLLLKANQMQIGMYGKPVHCWMLKTNKLQLFN